MQKNPEVHCTVRVYVCNLIATFYAFCIFYNNRNTEDNDTYILLWLFFPIFFIFLIKGEFFVAFFGLLLNFEAQLRHVT